MHVRFLRNFLQVEMAPHSTLFCFFLSITLVCGLLPPEPRSRSGEAEALLIMRNQDRQPRSDNSQGKLKVLDFSADTDKKLDSNGEYTHATLNAGPLPESFTICSALMVDSWPTKSARMFLLYDPVAKVQWGYIYLSAAFTYTQYDVKLGEVFFVKQIETVFFPLQCTMCILGSMFSFQPNKLRHILKFVS